MNVPSGYTALDLIGFTDRGDYDSTANYVKNDLVHHNNSIWRCLVDDTTAVTPAEGANWTVYIQNGTTLNGMADVNLTTPANGDLLRYNSTSSKWENQDVDSTPTQSSTKLVQSGGVYTQLENKANTADLAAVATTGAYSDLSGTPQLAQVATTGQYSDLSGQPTIPTVNDATLTIQKNGTNVETFTANSSTNKTANITVPDVINDLSDVNISSVANEEILAYDSASSKWKNSGALGALKEALTNQSYQNGAVNLFDYTATSDTVSGVTFTMNSDKTVTVNGKGTNTNNYSTIYLGSFTNFNIGETYKVSGCPSDGANNKYEMFWVARNSSSTALATVEDTGSGGTITIPSNTVRVECYIRCYYNVQIDSKIFKPMLTYSSMVNSDYAHYVPYAAPNKDLLSYKDNGVLGAKNLLNVRKLINHSPVGGLNFQLNDDGSVTIQGGTTTSEFQLLHGFIQGGILSTPLLKPNTTYIFSIGTGKKQENLALNVFVKETSSSGWTGLTLKTNVDSITFTTPATIYDLWIKVQVSSGKSITTTTIYPMIRLASDTDPTYQPYAKTNQQLTKDDIGLTENEFVNGAVNLLDNIATTQVVNGVTYTRNADGSVIANGTANADTWYEVTGLQKISGAMSLKMSGCPANGDYSTYSIQFTDRGLNNTSDDAIYRDTGNGVEFSISVNHYYRVHIRIKNGVTVSNLVFKPMLTVADVPNSDYNHYVPYAKSNKELTNLAQQLDGNYVLTRRACYLKAISASNTKKRNVLMAEFMDDFVAEVSSYMDTNDLIIVTHGSAGGVAPGKNTVPYPLSKSEIAVTSIVLSDVDLTNTVIATYETVFTHNSATCTVYDNRIPIGANPTVTCTNYSGDTPTSGTMNLYYMIYKKIS